MADALPPETAKVQIETLKAFRADLELSVRSVAKGYGSKPVYLAELRVWLNDALASNTDAARRPREGAANAPYVTGPVNREVLGKVLTKVKTRIADLEGGKLEPKEPVKQWLTAQLVDASATKVLVPDTKGGGARVATVEEVRGWLTGAPWVDDSGY